MKKNLIVMSVGANGETNKKNDKLHLADALKGLAHVGCAGSYKFGPGPGLLSRMH